MISLVIPARNEEANIPNLIEGLDSLDFEKEVIIVNDNSTDSTKKMCQDMQSDGRITTVDNPSSPGMGNALKAGTKVSKGEIVVWMMADLSDDLNTVPKIIDQVKNGADIAFGSRYMKGGSSGDLDPVKAFLSSSFSRLARFLYGISVHDITNSFRAFRRSSFESLNVKSSGFSIAPEMALKAHIKKMNLQETPTIYATRKKGKPKMKVFKTTIMYFLLILSLWPSFLKSRL